LSHDEIIIITGAYTDGCSTDRNHWWRLCRYGDSKVCLDSRCSYIRALPHGILNPCRYLAAEHHFEKIDIFEQRSVFGGLWNFCPADLRGTTKIPQTDPHQPLEEPKWNELGDQEDYTPPIFPSPMYEGLETNIPHFLMRFSDSPALEKNQLCPSMEATLQYLKEYADDVKDMVQFHTQVTEVLHRATDGKDIWLVQYRDLLSGKAAKGIYDAIVVASGHYTVPYIPDIPGIREWNQRYPGIISHSKFYQRPQDFVDQKVLIIGYAASGRDIFTQIARCSHLPVIISHRSSTLVEHDTVRAQFMPEVVEFLPSSSQAKSVRFLNGHVETNLDAVIFCTGYLYSYPFLSAIQPPFIGTGERVQHLYQHIFSIDHPSLAFVGLPKPIIPFPTCEGQAAVIARAWSGRLQLPSMRAMREWETTVVVEQGGGKKFHDLTFPKDIEYHNTLVEWSLQAKDGGRGKLPKKWSSKDRWVRERCPAIKQAFLDKGETRHMIMTMDALDFLDYDT
jgi:cation diffusion facilitator CzcD-associated flavoprotein CzcO